MKKKLLSIVMILAMLLGTFASLAACNDLPGEDTGSETSSETESVDANGTGDTDTGADESSGSETSEDSEPGSESTSDSESETEPQIVEADYANGGDVKDAGTAWDEDIFVLKDNKIDESKAVVKTAEQMLALLTDKANETDKAEGKVFKVTEPLKLSSNTKYYGNYSAIIAEGGIIIENAESVVVKELIIKGNITITGSKDITFFKLDLKAGEVGVTIDKNSKNVALKNCIITATDTAIKSDSETLSVYQNMLTANKGVISSGDGLAVQNTTVKAGELGISSSGEYCTVKNNLIEASKDGVGVEFTQGSVNGLIALNVIKSVQLSVKVSEGFNCVVLLNSAVRVSGENNKNLYVVENNLGGAIELKNNKYLLCDGNKFVDDDKSHPVVNTENSEFNGDNLHDVTERLDVGAKEDLLPHTNKDLFVGMDKQNNVRDISLTKSYSVNNYVRTMGRQSKTVIVPPGLYSTVAALSTDAAHAGVTLYAYGAMLEKQPTSEEDPVPTLGQVIIIQAQNFKVKGLTMGYNFQSSGQAYVLEKTTMAKKQLLLVAAAGYYPGFRSTNPTLFVANKNHPDIFSPGSMSPDRQYEYDIVKDNGDGTFVIQFTGNTAREAYVSSNIGDIFVCRLSGDNKQSVTLQASNILLKDCVLYGYSSALAVVANGRGTTGVKLERFHNTSRPSWVISKEEYERYVELEKAYNVDLEVYIDENGLYRGSIPRIGSVDGTHIVGAEQGVSAESTIFENMCDDASNQRYSSSRLAGYKVNEADGTTTLYIKGTLSYTYLGINAQAKKTEANPTSISSSFRKGDKMYSYASDGHVAIEANILSDAKKVTTLPEGVHLLHIDEDNNCICDDASCKALLHYDIGYEGNTPGNYNLDGYCDVCNTKVYTDFDPYYNNPVTGAGDGKCSFWKEENEDGNKVAVTLVDANGDGLNDKDKVPIVSDRCINPEFNSNGQLTYQIRNSSNLVIKYLTDIYEVTVNTSDIDFDAFEGVDFTDNDYYMQHKVLVDNISLNSSNFTFDNVLMADYRSRGILMKSPDSTAINCTFRNIGTTGMLLSVETSWGESTVPKNITIEKCLFDNVDYFKGDEYNLKHSPIAILGLGDISNDVTVSENTLPCTNIKIIGNRFINTTNAYAISINAASNITIYNNTFVGREDIDPEDVGGAIMLNGVMNVDMSGNTFEKYGDLTLDKIVVGWNYKGLTGSDLVDKDGNRLYASLPKDKDEKRLTAN